MTAEEIWAEVLKHEGLAHRICRRVLINNVPEGSGIDFEWLKSEAWEGLYKAIETFDASKGVTFAHYAAIVMTHRLWREIVRAEGARGGRRGHIKSAKNNGGAKRERWATVSSIEADTEWLTSRFGDGDGILEPDYLAVPGFEEEASDEAWGQYWMSVLGDLEIGDHARQAVTRRLEGATLGEIGDELGITAEGARQLIARVVRKLQVIADRDPEEAQA